jgi:hypothetical protein
VADFQEDRKGNDQMMVASLLFFRRWCVADYAGVGETVAIGAQQAAVATRFNLCV